MVVHCAFHSSHHVTGIQVHSCDNDATSFVRILATKRLVPFCDPCKKSFVIGAARARSNPAHQELRPGAGYFEDVSLEEGMDGYLKQPPATEKMKQNSRDVIRKLSTRGKN
jgi:hypothetical protein